MTTDETPRIDEPSKRLTEMILKGEELSPEGVVRNHKNLKPDVLAIPLVTTSAVNDLLRTRSLLANSGVKTKLVTYGRGVAKLPSDSQLSAMEEDSLSILSRIAEILISR